MVSVGVVTTKGDSGLRSSVACYAPVMWMAWDTMDWIDWIACADWTAWDSGEQRGTAGNSVVQHVSADPVIWGLLLGWP